MMKIHKILFPTDFSRCAEQAMQYALYVAKQFNAELHMLHAVVPLEYDPNNPAMQFPDLKKINAEIEKITASKLGAALAAHDVKTVKIKQAQRQGLSIAPMIMEYASENDIDLIIMGTHGRRGLGHLFLGSVAEEVVRFASCPVFTVRERKVPHASPTIKSILAPVDFSEHARLAVRHAKEIAARNDARLILLHVVEQAIHPAFYTAGVRTWSELVPELLSASQRELERMLKEVKGPTVPTEIQVVEGNAVGEITKFADSQNLDLIVIATHGLTGIEHFLLGSTTEKVIRTAPCPVLTVKAFGKSLA